MGRLEGLRVDEPSVATVKVSRAFFVVVRQLWRRSILYRVVRGSSDGRGDCHGTGTPVRVSVCRFVGGYVE